jgi:hypothetical protein
MLKRKRKKIYSLLQINNFEIINIKADGLFKKREKKFNLPDLETLLNGWGGDAHFYPVSFDNVMKFKFNMQRFEFSYSYIPEDEDINFKKEGTISSNKFYSFWFLDIRERIHEVLQYRSENPDVENPYATKVSGFNKGIMDSDNIHVGSDEEKSSKSSKSSKSGKSDKKSEGSKKDDEVEFKKFKKKFKLDVSADVMSDEKKNDEKKNAMRNKRKSLRQNRLTLKLDDENAPEYKLEEDDKRVSRKYSIASDASFRKSMVGDSPYRKSVKIDNNVGDD